MATPQTPRAQRTGRAKAGPVGVPFDAPGATAPVAAPVPPPQVGRPGQPGYVVPLVHCRLSQRVVNAGFWTALAGAAALGVLDLPLAALIGGAVYVARHQARSGA
jgi:hypothetical protein